MNGLRRSIAFLATLALVSGMAPVASAHNAEVAPEQYIRFLSDCSDDWGGHSAVRDGHDLVALDMTERWLPEANEPGFFVMLTIAFGFAETGSQGGPLRIDAEVTGPDGAFKTRLKTSDNKAFTAETAPGFLVPDVTIPARPSLLSNGQQDGSRVLVEYGFRYSTLGLQVGDKVTAAKAQGFARDERGDYMPGGYYVFGVNTGGERDCPQSGHQGSGDLGSLYIRKDYTMRGAQDPYFDLSLNTDTLTVSGNSSSYATLTLTNKFAKQAQQVVVTPLAPAGWTANVVSDNRAEAAPLTSLPVEIQVQATSGTANNGSLRLLVDTSQGGHADLSLPLYWYPAGVELPHPTPTSAAESPSLSAALPTLVMLVLALARSRRT